MTSIVRVIARKMDGIQEALGTRLHFFGRAVENCGTFHISASADHTLLQIKLSLILLPIMFVPLFDRGAEGGKGRIEYPTYETMQLSLAHWREYLPPTSVTGVQILVFTLCK